VSSNILSINSPDHPHARIEAGELVLENFRERDAQVVELAEGATDIDGVVHDCLVVGARALTAAQATTDVAVVEKAFGDMTAAFSRGLDEFGEELETKAKELLDEEEGALPRSFEEFKTELEKLLGTTFDPDRKQSVIGVFEQVMRKGASDQLKAMRQLIDPDNDESPLGRYRTEIVKSVEKETSKLQAAFEELKAQIAVEEAKAEMFELTTKKGFTFEDELESRLIDICEPCGDVAERVGGTAGSRGKKGDFVVRVNPEDVAGQDVCFTIEAKNQKMSLRDTLKELDRCIANRDALAGIAVFAKQNQCPGDTPFQSYGNRGVVIYDEIAGGELALRLAVAWARWVVRRQLSATVDVVDLDRIGSLIESARHALRAQSTIDRALTTSTNKIAEAKGHLASLVADVEAALASIEHEIAA
jgi:hypothetical protein